MNDADIDKILKERRPIFFFTDKSRIVGVWLLLTKDWESMSMVWRDDPKDDWTLRSRLRVIKDGIIWGSKDDKHVMSHVIHADETEDAIVENMKEFIAQLGRNMNAPKDAVVHEIILRGGLDEFVNMIRTHPAFHTMEMGAN